MTPEGDLGPSNLEPPPVLGTLRGIASSEVVDDGLRVGVPLTARGAIEDPTSLQHPMNVEREGVIRGSDMKAVRIGIAGIQRCPKPTRAMLGVCENVLNQRRDPGLSVLERPSVIEPITRPVVEPVLQSLVSFLESDDLTRDLIKFREAW